MGHRRLHWYASVVIGVESDDDSTHPVQPSAQVGEVSNDGAPGPSGVVGHHRSSSVAAPCSPVSGFSVLLRFPARYFVGVGIQTACQHDHALVGPLHCGSSQPHPLRPAYCDPVRESESVAAGNPCLGLWVTGLELD